MSTSVLLEFLKKLKSPKINDLMKKWANELNTTFSKEEVQIAKKIKKCSTSLTMQEMEIKTMLKFNLFKWLSAGTQPTNVGENVRKKEPSCTVVRNVN
jgi:hypothetical protein